MNKSVKQLVSLILVFLCSVVSLTAQNEDFVPVLKSSSAGKSPLVKSGKSLNSNQKSNTTAAIKVDTKASDYKFITIDRDTSFVDTTLSIQKEYRYNYLRKDYFELLPFSNTGRVFNQLGYDFSSEENIFSLFGARAKHIDYAEVKDVKYYNVATPFTEMFFKTTMEQGQLADVFFAVNTTPNLNIAAGYKGLRSIGKYRSEKTNGGKFKLSVNYNTKNKRYFAKAHVAMQSIENQENGGITDQGVIEFENENTEFKDRSRFEVNLANAESKLSAKRFYINHFYDVLKQNDSTNAYALKVGHISNLEDKKYVFNHALASTFFGDSYRTSINDEVRLEKFYNQIFTSFYKDKIGELTAHVAYTDYNYGYDRILNLVAGSIPNRIKGNFASYGVSYKNKIGKLALQSKLTVNASSENKGNFFKAKAQYSISDSIQLTAKITIKEALPNFNYRLFQSDYKSYNWYNPDLLTTQTQTISGVFDAQKYAKISASLSTINNFTYFGLNTSNEVKPLQTADAITYLKLNIQKEFKFLRHFALDNTFQYQNITQNEPVLFVPEYIVRNTLYYENTFFKKNLFLQTGFIFNYFSKYQMNAFDPLLGEFYVQTEKQYGSYPRVDFFVNAKIRNARIYLKAEHFNSGFTGNSFYSAPNYPYKDFIIRFGLVWDFFL